MAGPPPLDVWLYGVHVARVTERRAGRFQLEYTAEAFERWPTGVPLLSVALPLVPRPAAARGGRGVPRRARARG